MHNKQSKLKTNRACPGGHNSAMILGVYPRSDLRFNPMARHTRDGRQVRQLRGGTLAMRTRNMLKNHAWPLIVFLNA